MNKRMLQKYYRGIAVIITMLFLFVVTSSGLGVKTLTTYAFILVIYNVFVATKIKGNTINLDTIDYALNTTKYLQYFTLGFLTVIDNKFINNILEHDYTLLTFFVVSLSFLEAITGYLGLRKRNKT
ncbi:hypothetical protein ACFQI7_13045 [Paenibacillus allorhizosphaerae]|uniref:Permease n=1 Tax=Paenibacillus allorhizosphaerae TaxID=2849866 RepID=A0ABM8VL49_9BACL|nr:hypothetical protein [Paenibacillus allorhizosphaerae]CAG7648123.1 hypothetical protein PAECIP111802_04130 [Paenibacillus allorhizosphaerae]